MLEHLLQAGFCPHYLGLRENYYSVSRSKAPRANLVCPKWRRLQSLLCVNTLSTHQPQRASKSTQSNTDIWDREQDFSCHYLCYQAGDTVPPNQETATPPSVFFMLVSKTRKRPGWKTKKQAIFIHLFFHMHYKIAFNYMIRYFIPVNNSFHILYSGDESRKQWTLSLQESYLICC